MVLFPQSTGAFSKSLRQLLVILVFVSAYGSLYGDSLAPGKSFDQPQFLPVDEAFLLTVTREGETLRVHWLVRPGYYLYRDRLSFNLAQFPLLPPGQEKWDEIFGEVEVYYTELSINLSITDAFTGDDDKFVIGYQGCADAGLCYPPQEREFKLDKI